MSVDNRTGTKVFKEVDEIDQKVFKLLISFFFQSYLENFLILIQYRNPAIKIFCLIDNDELEDVLN